MACCASPVPRGVSDVPSHLAGVVSVMALDTTRSEKQKERVKTGIRWGSELGSWAFHYHSFALAFFQHKLK